MPTWTASCFCQVKNQGKLRGKGRLTLWAFLVSETDLRSSLLTLGARQKISAKFSFSSGFKLRHSPV